MNENNGLDADINQEIFLSSNFKPTKQEQNGQIKIKEEAPIESDSEETPTNSRDFVNSSTQTISPSNNLQENNLGEARSGEIFSKELVSQDSSFKTQGCQTVPEQSTNGFGRPKLIQPIYIVYPDQQVGYIEVDLADENAMKNISEFLQKKPE